jgi:hypothetical protein
MAPEEEKIFDSLYESMQDVLDKLIKDKETNKKNDPEQLPADRDQ